MGQGPQRPELERLIAELGLEQTVLLCGPLPHEAVIEAYARAALFVLPCRQTKDGDIDGIPNVLPEAMAMGVPVISTRLSAIPELIRDGENGLLVSPDDPTALAEAMAALLSPVSYTHLDVYKRQVGNRGAPANHPGSCAFRRGSPSRFWPC